ncbi:MAG TPA: lipopolysaccharide biosynthesis protein [Ohtaekwangia sp.]
MISKRFIKSSLIYTLAGALPMASAIVLIPFYIKYLPTEVYGALAICLAFSAFVQIVVTYSFDSSLYIHYHELKHTPEKLAPYISSAFIFILALGTLAGIFFSITGQLIFAWLLPESDFSFYPYGLVSVGVGVFQSVFKVYGHLLQTREKPETFLWANVTSFSVVAITTIVGLQLFPGSLLGPLGGRLLANSGSAVWVLFRVFREYGFHFKSPWQNTSFSFNAYTYLYQLQQWVVNYADRFVILFALPVAAVSTVGIYELAIKCLAPVELLLNGLNASINPQIVKAISQQEPPKTSTPEINRYSYGLVSVIMLAVTVAILIMPWLVDWFITKTDYSRAIPYLPYIAAIFIFKAMRLYFILPYSVLKKMNNLTAINLFVSLLKIVLMLWFIRKWELYGVIMSSALAYFIEMILLWYYLKDHYIIRFNFFKLIAGPLALFCLILIVEPMLGNVYPALIHFVYVGLCVMLLWFLYRNELKFLDPLKILKLK